MKIGIISGEFPPMTGGVGDFSRNLAERIQQQGHHVQALSRDGTSSDTVSVTTVSGWGLRSLPRLQAWADAHAFDIINLQYQTAAYDMSPAIHLLASVFDTPLVTTLHDLRHPYLFPKAGRLRDWTVMHLASSSDGLIVTNPEDKAKLSHLERVALIPIGSNILTDTTDSDSLSHWRERMGGDASTILIGHFGFVNESKGVHHLIEAIAELRRAGHNLRLVFIGKRGNPIHGDDELEYASRLDKRINELELAESIHWTGYLPESAVAACLKAVDMVVLPFVDGASYRRTSLMAAIHCGCAIVTTTPAVEHEAFKHRENLWLTERESQHALADAIALLIAHPERVAQLRLGAKELRQFFDWDIITRDTIAFFDSVLQAAGRRREEN